MACAESSESRHAKLVQEGWERRFTTEEPRLTEMKQFYKSLGLEVIVEPGSSEAGQECRGCFDMEGFEDRYKTLYTRGQQSLEKADSDGPFD